MSTFGRDSTTDDVLAGHDLAGVTVFITGANFGGWGRKPPARWRQRAQRW